MNWFKRTYCYLFNHFSKVFLLLIIIFTLGNLLYCSISLKLVYASIGDEIKLQLGATIRYCHSTFNDPTYRIENEEDYYRFKEYEKMLNQLIQNKNVNYGGYSYFMELLDENENTHFGYGVYGDEMIAVNEHQIQVVEGRTFSQNEIENQAMRVMLPQSLLEQNKLKIGDKFTIKQIIKKINCTDTTCFEEIIDEENYYLEIIGTFKKIDKAYDNGNTGYNDLENRIYLPNSTIWKIYERTVQLNQQHQIVNPPHISIQNPFVRLKSSDYLDQFIQENQSLLVEAKENEDVEFITSNDELEKVIAPLTILNDVGNAIIVGSCAVFAFLLTIVFSLYIKERQHEIGIYLAIGESKFHVMLQLIFEMLNIMLAALGFSMISGKYFGQMLISIFVDTMNIQAPQLFSIVFVVVGSILIVSMMYPLSLVFKMNPMEILNDE